VPRPPAPGAPALRPAETRQGDTRPAQATPETGPTGWDHAKQTVRAAGSHVAQEVQEAEVLAHARKFLRAAEERDLESLKRLTTTADAGDYGAILDCYYDAFAIENDQGPEAARRYLADEKTKGGSPAKIWWRGRRTPRQVTEAILSELAQIDNSNGAAEHPGAPAGTWRCAAGGYCPNSM